MCQSLLEGKGSREEVPRATTQMRSEREFARSLFARPSFLESMARRFSVLTFSASSLFLKKN